jgi:DNA-binding HxlR family transcriptional regulator
MKRPASHALCPRFHFAVELIGRRWTGAILYLLVQAPARFVDLHNAIPGITDPMLSERLRELEAEAIVERTVLPGAPVRVQYALTAKGRALGKVMRTVGDWSHRWLAVDELPAGKPARRRAPRRV